MKTSKPPRAPFTLAACAGLLAAVLWSPSRAAAADPAAASKAGQTAAQQATPNQSNDGSDYIAAWSVMGEICEEQYPQMKPAVEEFWSKRWDKATRERVADMKRTPEFHAKVLKHRKNLNARKDEILAQCGRLFTGGAH